MIVTRFAPSPTGKLHLGHAASALFAYENAIKTGDRFLLRIEDIDPARCRPEYIDRIYEDLRWLGLTWEEPVRRQSEHAADYSAALEKLEALGVLYPCFCTRREILDEVARSGFAPHADEDGPIYPGTCRILSPEERTQKNKERPAMLRLDSAKAVRIAGQLVWHDRAAGRIEAHPERFGDIVLARKDVPASYHLCVTVDDALQGITLVTRGEDLMPSTDVHVLLQKLLNLPTPEYHHHPLLLDENGKKFSKRDQAVTLAALRESGVTQGEIRMRTKF